MLHPSLTTPTHPPMHPTIHTTHQGIPLRKNAYQIIPQLCRVESQGHRCHILRGLVRGRCAAAGGLGCQRCQQQEEGDEQPCSSACLHWWWPASRPGGHDPHRRCPGPAAGANGCNSEGELVGWVEVVCMQALATRQLATCGLLLCAWGACIRVHGWQASGDVRRPSSCSTCSCLHRLGRPIASL